jgi:hypothetical protein
MSAPSRLAICAPVELPVSFVPIIIKMMCGAPPLLLSNAGLGMSAATPATDPLAEFAVEMVQPLRPSFRFGKGCPDTVLGPLLSEPVKVIFCPAATASANRGPR